MSFILGMDTGGTYTDGVIVDSSRRKIICKAKALTTKEDLTKGLKNCLEALEFDRWEEITLVSLSTTLATNAIVEGRGAKTGLIYLGMDPEEEIPADRIGKVKGRFDIMGRLQEELEAAEIERLLLDWKGTIEALAVSGYASVRNPKHEQEIRALAERILDIPVVCAHQLTSALGFHHRTVTAVLNARLIPTVEQLIHSAKAVLRSKNVHAPIMTVKGDGTLMTEAMTKERPIETILSGPAASVIGGLALTGRKDGFVLDMGGTTTDIANVTAGTVKIRKEGAKVGGWLTRVQAIEISTFGLGGDSRICLDKKGDISIGPEKVCPLCVAGQAYPQLIHELKSFKRVGEFKTYSQQEADCFMYLKGELPPDVFPQVKKIFEKLKGGPHSLTYLARAIGEDPETIDLTPLVDAGLLGRISLTPTDLLHFQGKWNRWNRDLSQAGIEILARRKGITASNFAELAERAIKEKMAMCCVQSAADFSGETLDFENSREAMYLLEKAFENKGDSLLKPKLSLGKPVVAIGAPAGAWVLCLEELLCAEVIVPEDADVANAYGAAVGQVTETAELLISADKSGFILNTPWDRTVYKSREEAMFYAIHEGRKHIEHLLADAGCRTWNIEEKSEDIMVETRENEDKIYMGTKLVITGIGSAL